MRRLVSLLLFVVAMVSARAALAEPVRLLVAAGSKTGLPAERTLKFADNDATRVRDVMVTLGGVRAEHATLLSEPTRAQLFAAIDKAKAEALKHKPEEVTLVFYFSGHGDRDAIHLPGDRVAIAEVSTKLAEVPAALRIAVTDACRSTREKGFTADEPFAISASLLPSASGQVWLHASSDGEAAQESDELQGAIFTHAWLNGLRGAADANGDARVTLDESFAFASSQTLIRSAKSSGVLQKPEAVVNLHEGGPVVLTQTATKLATLSLPPARDTHFLVYSAGAKSVLSELWSSPERRLLLRLPPGRYVVHRRVSGSAGFATIAVGENEERKLDDKDFRAGSLELLARKGGAIDGDQPTPAPAPAMRHHEVSAGWDAGANLRTGFVHGPRVGYAYAWSHLALSLGGGADFSGRTLDTSEEKLVSGFGRAAIELRLPLGSALVLRGSAGARAGVLAQKVTSTSPLNPAPDDHESAFVVGPEAGLALRALLGSALFADLGGNGSIVFLREAGSLRGITGAVATLTLGARF